MFHEPDNDSKLFSGKTACLILIFLFEEHCYDGYNQVEFYLIHVLFCFDLLTFINDDNGYPKIMDPCLPFSQILIETFPFACTICVF